MTTTALREQTVNVAGKPMFVSEAGDGLPVVMLHGGGPGASGVSNYSRNIDALAERFRVIVPDMPGYGRSAKGIGQSDPFGYLADMIRGLLDELGLLTLEVFQKSREEVIVRQQREFLDRGIEHLRPMVLRDVAEDIGMHESTVSRVVSNKYIHTQRGLFPMKFFFHSGIDREYGDNISSLTVKRKIEQMVQAEDPKRPLSDSELMRILNREGIQIARRTVAKYREDLHIPSTHQRRRREA